MGLPSLGTVTFIWATGVVSLLVESGAGVLGFQGVRMFWGEGGVKSITALKASE
jgi:hypothetical protein